MTAITVDVRAPTVEEGGAAGVLAAWHKQPGDPVAAGEPVADVEVDKAVLEVLAPAAGVLVTHLVALGAPVQPGQPLAAVQDPAAPPTVPEVPAPRAVPGRVPLSAIRRRIGANLVRARATQALVTTVNEVDVSAVQAARDRYAQLLGVRLGMLPFFVRAAVLALHDFPGLNAEIEGTDVVYHDRFDIGVAMATDRGLLVPVLRDADRGSLTALDERIMALAERARTGTLTPAELTGGTFTVTNGGVFGSLLSTPIVNAPQAGILGMHAVKERPVAVDGEVVVRPMMYLAFTYDHRLVDGADAVRFLARVVGLLDTPDELLAETEG